MTETNLPKLSVSALIAFALAVGAFAAVCPLASAANNPSQVQYDYDPIIKPGNGNNRGEAGNHGRGTGSIGAPGTGAELSPNGAPGDSGFGQGSEGKSRGKRGDVDDPRNGNHIGDDSREGQDGSGGDEDAIASFAKDGDSGSGSGGVSITLIAILALIAAGFVAKWVLDSRAGSVRDSGFRVKVATLTLMTMLLVVFGGTKALASVPKAPSGFFGIAPQEEISTEDSARMRSGNVTSVRYPLAWSLVKPHRDSDFDWGHFDTVVRNAARNRVSVLPTVYSTPAWVSPRTTNLPVGNGTQLKHWRQFVTAAVARYGPGGTFWEEHGPQSDDPIARMPIRKWQIWNEPNFHYFATPVSPANYGRLLKVSSRTIRRLDANAKVIIGGLYGRPKGPPRKAMHAATFLKRLSRSVPRNAFDSLALHAYAPNTKQLRLLVREYRQAANKAGYRAKSIIVTEIGWGSGSGNAFLKNSLQGQARQLRSAFNYLVRNRKKMRISGAYWFSWKDTDPKGVNCNFCYTVGLFRFKQGLAAKPAWRVFVRYTGGKP